jgi:hypothetical protein
VLLSAEDKPEAERVPYVGETGAAPTAQDLTLSTVAELLPYMLSRTVVVTFLRELERIAQVRMRHAAGVTARRSCLCVPPPPSPRVQTPGLWRGDLGACDRVLATRIRAEQQRKAREDIGGHERAPGPHPLPAERTSRQ